MPYIIAHKVKPCQGNINLKLPEYGILIVFLKNWRKFDLPYPNGIKHVR